VAREDRKIDEVSLDREKEGFDWGSFLEKNKWAVGLGLLGLVLVGAGLYHFLIASREETLVEIIPVEAETSETIWVDIEGALENPGIYELSFGARVNDLLIRAGGLSAVADRDWVEKNINLAQRLADGVKIYIPRQGELSQAAGSVGSDSIGGQININTASSSELDSLWGVGEKRAADIVVGRPYQSAEELLERKILPANVYERIKDQVSVY
jgi:competence protein ComEA